MGPGYGATAGGGVVPVFMTMTFVIFARYGAFAAGVRNHVIRRPRVVTWMRRTFAATNRLKSDTPEGQAPKLL